MSKGELLRVCVFRRTKIPSFPINHMTTLTSALLISSLPFSTHSSKFRTFASQIPKSPFSSLTFSTSKIKRTLDPLRPITRKNPFLVCNDDGDIDNYSPEEYEIYDEDLEEADNKQDFDIEYEPVAPATGSGGDGDIIDITLSRSFAHGQGWDSLTVADYRINEDEFHKIRLMDCDFFIRKPPDPDDDVYDFSEIYVTPPDTDVYAIPKILAPMPQKYIRCAKSDYGWYNVTEPTIDAPRDPLSKTEWEVQKVFLTKHFKNRKVGDPDFVLDFEEIYVIDSKTKSITRAKVVVKIPGGKDRDRTTDLLVIRDNGNSFVIKHASERDDPTTVIEREEWAKSRDEMERYLRKLKDFSISNWF